MQTATQEISRTTFHCQTENPSVAMRALGFALIGALVGAGGWFKVDQTVSFAHIAGWIGGGIVVFVPFAWLVARNPVLLIEIDDDGLTIDRARRPLRFAWSEIEAARIQVYAFPNTPAGTIRCLRLRAGGENFELTPEFDDKRTEAAFEEAILRELEFHDIAEASMGLPSFERLLCLSGAWVFVASIGGMLGAHLLRYHTMGTIVGVTFLFTGSVMAWMTRGERISRIVLAATVVLVLGGSAILWACDVNVRDVLNKWEWMEHARAARA